MSAFLGPIHSLMYNRIITMQKVVNAIADLSAAEGWNEDVDNYVIKEFPPIEEVVDLSNIHSSLFNMVEGAERRFAGIVAVMVKDHAERLEEVEAVVKATGESMRIEGVNTPEDACARLQEILLDGMPCDRAEEISQNANGDFEIFRTLDLHSNYFEAAELDGNLYYQMLKAFVEGLFSGTAIVVSGDYIHNIVVSS